MKKYWHHQFQSHILKRGENYYYRDRVHNLEYTERNDRISFSATVWGSHLYQVAGVYEEGYIKDCTCTCPYGETDHCKHMAAVMYALEYDIEIKEERERRKRLEEEKALREKKRKRIYPFQNTTGKYRYFDLDQITSAIEIYDLDYEDALRELEAENNSLQIDFGYDRRDDYKGMICFAGYSPSRMRFTRNTLLSIDCGRYGCDNYFRHFYGSGSGRHIACIHELKLLIMTDRYLAEHDIGDSTDYYAMGFLDSMRGDVIRKSPAAEAENTEPVHLIPRITKNASSISLSFRIGKGKLYSVKSLSNLVDSVSAQEIMQLGKKESLNFLTDSFDETGKQYLRFIQGCVNSHEAMRAKLANSYYCPALGSSVELTGTCIDTLFDLAEKNGGEFTNKNAGTKVRPFVCSHKDPQIRLAIHQDTEDGVFHGIKLEGSVPAFIPGVSSQYFLEETADKATLYRISEEAAANLEPIQKMGISGNISMSIGRNHLSEFYYDILPILQDTVHVDEPDASFIESQMPPKAQFIFYLDAIERRPMLRAESVYDGQVFPTADVIKENHPLESIRDVHRENQAMGIISRYFDEYDPSTDTFHMDGDDQDVYNLLDSGLKEFTAFGDVQSTSRFDALKIRKVSKVKVGVSIESDLMNLTISSGDLTPQELLEILKSYKLRKKYHRLPGGEFIDIDENIAELSAMVDALHLTPKQFIKGKINVPAYRALYLDKMLESLSGIQTSRDKHFRELIKNFKTVSESDYEVPDSLAEILRPYQTYGYQWLRMLSSCGFGGILADDMGLGKTLQMISVLLAVKEEGLGGTSLIVCPASLVYNWAEEFHRFAPSLCVGVVAGAKGERESILAQSAQYDVLITSYDLLKRDVPFYEEKQFEYQVLDEAQFIKTHTTAAAKSVKVINSKHRFALTGTPIENRLSELWSIFDYLMPGFLYGYEVFKKDFETPIVKHEDEEASLRLKRMVSPFILRRLKTDVLKDLPEKLEEVRYARFASDQQQLYDAQVVKLRGMIGQSDDAQINQNKIAILAELTRARQICCDPSLLFDNYHGESAKKEACLDLVRSAIQGEHRILLFSQFTSMLEILEEAFREEGIAYYKITGATPKQERIELVKAFNDGKVPLFLISLKAGGTGLNLTGADIVIHYDPWWNVAAQNQATDRAHRIGQTRTVCVYKLIAQNTIEEKIINMQKTKEKLADEILSGEMSGISGMTRQDLMDLLEC